MNILVLGIPFNEGMAGSLRVRNLLGPMIAQRDVRISNLYSFPFHENSASEDGSNILSIPLNPKNLSSVWSYLSRSFRFINKLKKGKQNILYSYDTPDIKTFPLILYAKLKGYKIILDIVEDSRSEASTVGMLNKLRIVSGVYLLKLSRVYADRILVLSSHLEILMKRYVPGNGRVVFVPVTVDFANFPTKIIYSAIPQKIFYGGSFAKKDGLECLIKAFDQVWNSYPSMELVLTGKGETGPDFEEIMKLIDGLPSKGSIHYLGYLSSQQYYKTLNEADIFIANRNNSMAAHTGFPSKLIEYLATGKAVIASNVGDVGRFLTHRKDALLVAPENQLEMQQAITLLLESPYLIATIGAEGRRTALRQFDNKQHSEAVYKLIAELV